MDRKENLEVFANNLKFDFSFREDGEFWYLGNNEFDIFQLGYSTNVTIYNYEINYEEVQDFLNFITMHPEEIKNKIEISNINLKEHFKELYSLVEPNLNFEHIFFTLCNIEFKAVTFEKNLKKFEYIFNFNAESKSDENFFTYDSWNSYFINNSLIKVSKS
jgi:hypothetical protein